MTSSEAEQIKDTITKFEKFDLNKAFNAEPPTEKEESLPKTDFEGLKDYDALSKAILVDLERVQNCHLPDNKFAVLDFDHKYLCNQSLLAMTEL